MQFICSTCVFLICMSRTRNRVAKKRQNYWNDGSEETFDVSRLFPDGHSEFCTLDLRKIDGFPVVDWNWNLEHDESHLQTDIRAVSAIIEEQPHAAQRMHNFEPMEFLNLEEMVYGVERSCCGPNVENSTCPFSLGTSQVRHTLEDLVHEDRQVEGTKFEPMDTTSHKNYESPPECSVKFCDVGEREDYSSPKIGEEVNENVVLPMTRRFQEHVQCPRCESFDIKFCYFNNHNPNKSRRICKTCKRKWTVGGTLRQTYPKSMVVQRVGLRRDSKSDQIVVDCGISVSDGPEECRADTEVMRSNRGSRKVSRNKQSVRKRNPCPSPVHALASDIKLQTVSSRSGNTATSGASISPFDFSQFRSSSAIRNGEEGLLQSIITANSRPLASIRYGAVHLAQHPRIYAGEPGPEFHGITPTVAPFSLPELRRLHGPVTVSLIEQLPARNESQLKLSQDLQFNDLRVLIPSRVPILGQEQEPMPMEMTVAPIRNDYGHVPIDRSECQHLNLNLNDNSTDGHTSRRDD